MKKTETSPTINKEFILAYLRAHRPELEARFGVTKIALFGSYARSEETPTSDIDLLIEAKEHNFRNRLRLRDFLEKEFQRTVDISYFESTRSFILNEIQKDLIYA